LGKGRRVEITEYSAPSGGWGSAKSLANILFREGVPFSGALALMRQNKPDGFQCVSCSWAKPQNPLPFEFCENGAKATAWEITSARCTPAFFAKHTVTELQGWADYDLEKTGRLTHPMRYDPASDKYVPVSWESAFAEIGHELRALPDRKSVVFYASGRASLETSFMWALLARMYGNNNLPDSSNMCHESTSVALPESIGTTVGTVHLEEFADCDMILSFGQNVGVNSPRMLHPLQEASKRGVPIVTFNPLKERGWEAFTNPQSPTEMLSGKVTRISSQYHQVKAGGDLAALMGMCKALIEGDDRAQAAGTAPVLDHAFIAEHTHGFEAFAANVRAYDWDDLERRSALSREVMEGVAALYARHKRVIAIYGMGLTQHRAGVENVQMVANLLLLRGNIGVPGAGICPVRGHSNVQGQRTVGITEKPELVPNDKLRELFGFEPPMEKGLNTVEACEGILDGSVRAFISLGGNFVHAIPDRDRMEPAWQTMRLTVQISTKLNRSHLINGAVAYLLPCRGRVEIDRQATGEQVVSMEDSTAKIHGSRGVRAPASRHLLSEPAIVAGIAKAALEPNPKVDWDGWVADYARVREMIGLTYHDFHDMSVRMWIPGGFERDLPVRRRIWKTATGLANFISPKGLDEDDDTPERTPETLRMMTLRSNDQFNTTVYGYDDRFRGIKGTRMVALINRADIDRLGLTVGHEVALRTDFDDGHVRRMAGFRVVEYDIPVGCIGTYYPETNSLIPVGHYALRSFVPAAKSVPVIVEPAPARDMPRAG